MNTGCTFASLSLICKFICQTIRLLTTFNMLAFSLLQLTYGPTLVPTLQCLGIHSVSCAVAMLSLVAPYRMPKPFSRTKLVANDFLFSPPLCSASRCCTSTACPTSSEGNSTGPPDYKPKWEEHKTWVFGSQYFMEINNTKTNKTAEGHAATGELFEAKVGEVLYTKFELSKDWVCSRTLLLRSD